MIVEIAPAKLNLALHVRRKRADGYHEIETLFAFCRDGDALSMTDGEPSLTVEGPFAGGLSAGPDNLVSRAARLFAGTFGVADDAAFVLDKRLPVASGIGGGSADAAAALRLLARRHEITRDDPALIACAASLGADVPACLLGRSAIGTGIGEHLSPIDGLRDIPVLLVNPGVAVSTGAVFAGWNGVDRGALPHTARKSATRSTPDILSVAQAGRNDLEAPARAFAPVIGDVLDLLETTAGTRLVRMSGSGATCFALFDTPAARSAAAAMIRISRPAWWCLESTLA